MTILTFVRTFACLTLFTPLVAAAEPQASEGARLVEQHKCEHCHESKVYGPPGSIYTRKDHKVTSWAKLKSQVAACNTMLNAGLFPEDEANIATFLNDKYYKLPTK